MPALDQNIIDEVLRASAAFNDVRMELRRLLSPGRARCGEVSSAELERVAVLLPDPHKNHILEELFARQDGKADPEWDGLPLFTDDEIAAARALEERSTALWSKLCDAAKPVFEAARLDMAEDEIRDLAAGFSDPFHRRMLEIILTNRFGNSESHPAQTDDPGHAPSL